MLSSWMYFWDWDNLTPPPTSATAEVVVISDPRGYGAKGNDYHPLPDDWWEDRAKIIKADKYQPSDVLTVKEKPQPPRPMDPATAAQISNLTSVRSTLSSRLLSLNTVDELKTMAGRIKELDSTIASLKKNRY